MPYDFDDVQIAEKFLTEQEFSLIESYLLNDSAPGLASLAEFSQLNENDGGKEERERFELLKGHIESMAEDFYAAGYLKTDSVAAAGGYAAVAEEIECLIIELMDKAFSRSDSHEAQRLKSRSL